jgi:hypothetical protein
MATKTYVRLVSGIVGEPAIELPDNVTLASVFGASAGAWIDVTSLAETPTVGMAVSVNDGTPTAAPAPALVAPASVVPSHVSRYRLKAALLAVAGTGGTMLDNVSAWVATQPEATQVMWSDAPYFGRNGGFILAAIAHFGWQSSTVDRWFEAAAAIAMVA